MNSQSTVPEKTSDIDALMRDDTVSTETKIQTLDSWRVDLLERQVATEENMAAEGDSIDSAELLRRVTIALNELRDD